MPSPPNRPFESITEGLDFLYRLRRSGVKLGLHNMERLCGEVGNPHRSFRVIHIAGTNGKGSVAAMLDAVLTADGCSVGCFTSPHLITFNERMRIRGQSIRDEDLLEMINELVPVLDRLSGEGIEPTFFEVCNTLAFLWFQRSRVDWAVVETGLGGRLDSTNIVEPEVTVITSIGMDHREFLGDTLEAIASEKAGIIKVGRLLVLGPVGEECREVILGVARQRSAPVAEVEAPRLGPVNPTTLHREIEWNGVTLEIGLPGRAQGVNAAICLRVIEEMRKGGREVSEASVVAGLRDVVWPARFQRIDTGPEIILDGAHNEPAWRNVMETWMEVYGAVPDLLVLGCLKNKWDHGVAEVVRNLVKEQTRIWLVPVTGETSVTPADFKERCACRPDRCIASVEELWLALEDEPADNRILISGSLYLAGEVLSHHHHVPGQSYLNG